MLFNTNKTQFGKQPGIPNPLTGAAQGLPGPVMDQFGQQTDPGLLAPAQSRLPQPPPSISTDPFDKTNRRQTLLNIGQAFLSSPDFFQGLGGAAGAVSGRMDDLRTKAKELQKRNISYGGPDDQFEIETMPDGTRSIRPVPEFQQAIRDKQAATKATLTPKDAIDLRSRAIHAIMQLPEGQREAAYSDLMNNPRSYGIDTTGMPQAYSPTYGNVMGSMGMTVPQAEAGYDRDQAFNHRVTVDTERAATAKLKALRPPSSGRPRSGGARRSAPSYGSDLDY